MNDKKLTPLAPHVFNAYYNWMLENNFPRIHIFVNIERLPEEMQFLMDHARPTGIVILNIAPQAIGHFSADQNGIAFNTRFNRADYRLKIPFAAIVLMEAPGAAFFDTRGFGEEYASNPPWTDSEPQKDKPSTPEKKRPTLRIVK